jgi:hypothetical protein
MPMMALDTEVLVRLAGNRKRTADSAQKPLHTTSGVTEPPNPCPPAELATHNSSPPAPAPAPSAASGAAVRGQASSPRAPYSNTEPGAPVSALAVPVNRSPSPSPKTQTPSTQRKDTARAGRTVRRKSRPAPIAN